MKIGDWLVVLLTFITGVAAGSFVYLIGLREFDIDPIKPSLISEFEIVVTNYGGCTRSGGCSSYRILSDGSYVFIAGDGVTSGGVITDDQLSSLKQTLFATDLEVQSVAYEPDFCESWVDGVDTTYSITRDGIQFEIDTCKTTADVDSDLLELLDWLWVQFREED